MSDHIEHACTNCGSLLHPAHRCDKPLQRNPDAAPQPAEPPAGAAEVPCAHCGLAVEDQYEHFHDGHYECPGYIAPPPQGGTPETDAATFAVSYYAGKSELLVKAEVAATLEHQRNEARAALAAAQAEVEALRATCGGMTAEQRFQQLMDVREVLLKAGHNFGLSCTTFYAQAVVDELFKARAELEQTRREVLRERELREKACKDWATTDDEVKAICAKHGIQTESGSDYFKTAHECVEELSNMLIAAEQRAEVAEALVAEYKTECGCPLCKRLTAQRDTAIRERDEARKVLTAIRDHQPDESFEFPADWNEQIAACPECQGWAKNHPIQRGICNTHRQPLYARERHVEHVRSAEPYTLKKIADAALAAVLPPAKGGDGV